MDWVQRRPLVAVLAGIAAVLVLAIGIETGFGTQLRHPVPPPPAKPAAPPESKLLPPVALVAPEQAYPETTARPLFVPTRRPAPVEVAGKSTFERGQYILQGVIVVGDQRTALIKEKASGRIHRVDKGKDVNGIVVESVEPTRVVIAQGGDRETLNLTVQKATPSAPGAAAAAPTADAHGPFAGASAQPATGAQPLAGAAPTVTVPPAGGTPPNTFGPGNRAATTPAAPAAGQPMTPEELLARRRARRNQPTQ